MPFTPKLDWQDSPSTATPITASELIRIENGIAEGARDGTESVRGNLELATAAEMSAGTDLTRVPSVKRVFDYIASTLTTASYASTTYVQTAIAAPRLITATAASMVPLTIKGAVSQTAKLLEVKNSSDAIIASIDDNGQITSGSSYTASGMFKANCRSSTTPAARFQAAVSQTGNMIIVQDSNGVSKFAVTADGTVNGANIGSVPGTSIVYSPLMVLNASDPVPSGTIAGTVVLRRPA